MKNTRLLIFLLTSAVALVLIVVLIASLGPAGGGRGASDGRTADGSAKRGSERRAGDDERDGRDGESAAVESGERSDLGRDGDHDAPGGAIGGAHASETPERTGDGVPVTHDHDGTAGSGRQARITAIAVFRGTPPVPKRIKMTPECGTEPTLDREVVVREDGALANVVVRVTDGAPLAGHGLGEVGAEVVQERCEYIPRVSAMLTGQSLRVTSRDEFLHNVHSFEGTRTIFNKGQPVPSSFVKDVTDLNVKSGPITLKCDVHPWMVSYVFVHPNPYIGVTGESGTATLLTPPGELTIEAWHETFGTKSQVVRVKEGEPIELVFEFP